MNSRSQPVSELLQGIQLGGKDAQVRTDPAISGSAASDEPRDDHRADGEHGIASEPGIHARYDHSLAEFPAFRFGKRRGGKHGDLIYFSDTIAAPGRSGERLEREWTVYPSAKWGYGGATTQALLFDLHQIWKTHAFRGTRIYFGTLRRLYQCQHPGKNPSTLDYTRLRRDLDILCGYEFDCANAFWDPVTRTYGDMRAWHLFTGWYEATRARADDPQQELPFGFVELSETFAKIARERGFFVTGFDSEFFHRLAPVEQRLALYLSKMFVSQEVHRRHEAELCNALPIEASRLSKRRQTLRQAAQGLVDKGYPNLAAFSLEKAARRVGMVAVFHRRHKVQQDQPSAGFALSRLPDEVRFLVEDIVEETGDPDSIPMWVRSIRYLGEAAVRYALSDLRSEQRQRAVGRSDDGIKNPGAWLTFKLMAMGEERGIRITRHPGQTRRS